MNHLRDILTKQGRPRVATPFTKGGRQYMVTGLNLRVPTPDGIRDVFTLQRLDQQDGEELMLEVTEEKFFAGLVKQGK